MARRTRRRVRRWVRPAFLFALVYALGVGSGVGGGYVWCRVSPYILIDAETLAQIITQLRMCQFQMNRWRSS